MGGGKGVFVPSDEGSRNGKEKRTCNLSLLLAYILEKKKEEGVTFLILDKREGGNWLLTVFYKERREKKGQASLEGRGGRKVSALPVNPWLFVV